MLPASFTPMHYLLSLQIKLSKFFSLCSEIFGSVVDCSLRDYAIIGLQGKVVSIQWHNAQFVKIKSNNEF